MVQSRRRQIKNYIVEKLKLINGKVSTLDSGYTYKTNLFNNVFNKLYFIDQVNDFPSIYLQAGTEVFIYQTEGNTEGQLQLILRCYVKIEDGRNQLEDLFEDISHVINRIGFTNPENMMNIYIFSTDSDVGLLDPYGIGEIVIEVVYEIND